MILTPYLKDLDPRVHKGGISMSEDPVLRVRILMPNVNLGDFGEGL